MKKILIADDRVKRQSQHLPNGEEDVARIAALKHVGNKVGVLFDQFLATMADGNFSDLLSYDIWIMHRSFLIENGLLAKIQALAKEYDKTLVLFSGGITQNSYSRDGHVLLSLNSKTLYSDNLIPFFESYVTDQPSDVLTLIYGKNWQLSSLLKYRHILSGADYPGQTGEAQDELEHLLGKMSHQQLNERITEILSLS